ncbi:MAG: hypothetical protein WAZ36_12465 [Sediminibacterium sp.]
MKILESNKYLDDLFKRINNIYPDNIPLGDEDYYATEQYENLLKILDSSQYDDDWTNWIMMLKMNKQFSVIDFSTYSICSPCRKVSIGYSENGIFYEIKILFSLIAPLYIVKVCELKNTIMGLCLIDFSNIFISLSKNEKEILINNKGIPIQTLENICTFLSIQQFFPRYTFFPQKLMNEVAPNKYINQVNKGCSTIFHLIFNDHEF